MSASKLKEFLDKNLTPYTSVRHEPAFTAQEVAATVHVRGKDMAKTVIVKIDGDLAMVVVRADRKVDLAALQYLTHAEDVRLASEEEFKSAFPDCEVGAMPPFGNLFDLPVYVDEWLADDDEIAFNAGTHSEVYRMKYADFDRLVQPLVADLT